MAASLAAPDLAELQQWTDARLDTLAHERICPATGTSVAEAWASEKRCLTRLPETLPEPFDLVAVRVVGMDALVAFEGRQYSVPFRFVGERVEVRGCAGTVQVVKDCAVIATHPRAPHRVHRLGDDGAVVVARASGCPDPGGRKQVVRAHEPQHPAFGRANASHAQPGPDLAVTLAVKGAGAQDGTDRLQQGRIRHRPNRTGTPRRFGPRGGEMPVGGGA